MTYQLKKQKDLYQLDLKSESKNKKIVKAQQIVSGNTTINLDYQNYVLLQNQNDNKAIYINTVTGENNLKKQEINVVNEIKGKEINPSNIVLYNPNNQQYGYNMNEQFNMMNTYFRNNNIKNTAQDTALSEYQTSNDTWQNQQDARLDALETTIGGFDNIEYYNYEFITVFNGHPFYSLISRINTDKDQFSILKNGVTATDLSYTTILNSNNVVTLTLPIQNNVITFVCDQSTQKLTATENQFQFIYNLKTGQNIIMYYYSTSTAPILLKFLDYEFFDIGTDVWYNDSVHYRYNIPTPILDNFTSGILDFHYKFGVKCNDQNIHILVCQKIVDPSVPLKYLETSDSTTYVQLEPQVLLKKAGCQYFNNQVVWAYQDSQIDFMKEAMTSQVYFQTVYIYGISEMVYLKAYKAVTDNYLQTLSNNMSSTLNQVTNNTNNIMTNIQNIQNITNSINTINSTLANLSSGSKKYKYLFLKNDRFYLISNTQTALINYIKNDYDYLLYEELDDNIIYNLYRKGTFFRGDIYYDVNNSTQWQSIFFLQIQKFQCVNVINTNDFMIRFTVHYYNYQQEMEQYFDYSAKTLTSIASFTDQQDGTYKSGNSNFVFPVE